MLPQDCASSFTKGNYTYNENDPGFKALQRCATLCNVSVFKEDSKVDKSGMPVPFKKLKVQGDGSTIEVSCRAAAGVEASPSLMRSPGFLDPSMDYGQLSRRRWCSWTAEGDFRGHVPA